MSLEPRRHRLRHRARPIDLWIAGEGSPVVLLHGWGLSGRPYRHVLRALAARGFRAIAPSVSIVDGPWSLPALGEATAEAIAAVDATRPALVGHSFGGAVAVRLAVDRPEFASALVLVNSLGISPGPRRLAQILLPGQHWRIAAAASTAGALIGTAVRPGGPASLARAARWILTTSLEQELRTLHDWAIPAVVLWAERDTLLPRSIGERAAALLGCSFEVVRAGDGWPDRRPPDHDWPLRGPGFFAQRVVDALGRLLPA